MESLPDRMRTGIGPVRSRSAAHRGAAPRRAAAVLALAAAGLLAAGPASGQTYLSIGVGAEFASGLQLQGSDDDRNAVCDEFVNPSFADVPGCTGPRGDRWTGSFDGVTGVLAGAAVGYGLRRRFPDRLAGRFRIEGEYFHRAAAYDQASGVSFDQDSSIAADEADIVLSEDHLGGVGGRHLFGNLYFDFPGAGRFVPYVGVGAGVGFTGVDYEALGWWSTDPARIGAGEGLPNAEAIRRRLAGTLIRERTRLGGTQFGYQLLFGADYALTASLSLGVKGRLVDLGAFRDSGAWDVLRGHESQLRLDGSEPVTYRIGFDDVRTLGVSLYLEHRF